MYNTDQVADEGDGLPPRFDLGHAVYAGVEWIRTRWPAMRNIRKSFKMMHFQSIEDLMEWKQTENISCRFPIYVNISFKIVQKNYAM